MSQNPKMKAYRDIKKGKKPSSIDECLMAIDYDCRIIAYLPECYKTKEVCFAALQNNRTCENIIQYLSASILTHDTAVDIVGMHGEYIQYLPEECINDQVIVEAIKHSDRAIRFVPEQYRQELFYQRLVETNYKIIKYIENPSIVNDVIVQTEDGTSGG